VDYLLLSGHGEINFRYRFHYEVNVLHPIKSFADVKPVDYRGIYGVERATANWNLGIYIEQLTYTEELSGNLAFGPRLVAKRGWGNFSITPLFDFNGNMALRIATGFKM
jgi:hypothetical protein